MSMNSGQICSDSGHCSKDGQYSPVLEWHLEYPPFVWLLGRLSDWLYQVKSEPKHVQVLDDRKRVFGIQILAVFYFR